MYLGFPVMFIESGFPVIKFGVNIILKGSVTVWNKYIVYLNCILISPQHESKEIITNPYKDVVFPFTITCWTSVTPQQIYNSLWTDSTHWCLPCWLPLYAEYIMLLLPYLLSKKRKKMTLCTQVWTVHMSLNLIAFV